MTEVEFEAKVKAGANLHILDNLVLDLSDFYHKHPGGAFLLKYTVGRDISKFFYGGHGLDGNLGKVGDFHPANTHSNIARKIANRHVVGIIGKRNPPEFRFVVDDTKTKQLNTTTKSLTYRIADSDKNKLITGL